MIYTVVYEPAAEAKLADLYNKAADKQAVSDSSNRIDAELRIDPDRKGIPFGRFRAYYDDPLAVLYEVNPGDCMVRVVVVKRIT
jgi:hypothetical protein